MLSDKYKLDKFMKFTNDVVFRELFTRPEHKELLCCALALYFEVSYNEVYDNINYLPTKLPIDSFDRHKSEIDLLITYNDKLFVEVEMNNQFWKGLDNRNIHYVAKVLSNQLPSGSTKENFKNMKPVIQLNLNNYNIPKNREIIKYGFNELDTPNKFSDILEIHQLNLVEIRKKKYNDISKLKGYEKVGLLMSSESLEDAIRICKGIMSDEDLEKVIKRIYELNTDPNLWLLYDKEDLNRQISESKKQEGLDIGLEKGEAIGLEKGLSLGKEEGKIEEKIEIAKNMLNKDMDINLISDITGLTVEEISKLT